MEENNHHKRDLQLPAQRMTLLKEIEKDVLEDENIMAVFYGGSIGEENTDLYSDIDLRIVVKDECYKEYQENKRKRSENWGKVLFYEDSPWTSYSVAHFENFIKVDTFYYRMQDIQPSIWLRHINIIHDPTGYVAHIQRNSLHLTYFPTTEEVDHWRDKFFAYVHEAYRRAMRGETYYALQCLDNLRLSIATAWYMEQGIQPNTFGDWAKIEGERSQLEEWQLELLSNWHSGRDAGQLLHVIRSMVPEFKQVHQRLCEKVGLEVDEVWVDTILKKVL